MPIRRRGESYQADVRAGNPKKRYRKHFRTLEGAQNFEQRMTGRPATIVNLVASASLAEASDELSERPVTMDALLETTYERYWKMAKASKGHVYNANLWVVLLGENRDPRTVRGKDIVPIIEKWKKGGIANSTCNRRLAALSRMMRLAEREGWIMRRPILDRLKEAPGRQRTYSPDEMDKIIAYFQSQNLNDIVELTWLLLDSGLRVAEAVALEFTDCRDGLLHVREGKTEAAKRVVPMTERVAAIINRRVEAAKGKGKLFGGMTCHGIHQQWNKMRKAIGTYEDKEFVMHTLRHTCITNLVQRGTDLPTVMAISGHKSIQMTRCYTHPSAEHLKKWIEAKPKTVEPRANLAPIANSLGRFQMLATPDGTVHRLDTVTGRVRVLKAGKWVKPF